MKNGYPSNLLILLFLDPDGFSRAKAEFLLKHPQSNQESGIQSHSPSTPQSEDELSGEQQSASAMFPITDTKSIALQEQTTPISSSPISENPLNVKTDLNTDPIFSSAQSLLNNTYIPETELVIKKGHVRRHAGKRLVGILLLFSLDNLNI